MDGLEDEAGRGGRRDHADLSREPGKDAGRRVEETVGLEGLRRELLGDARALLRARDARRHELAHERPVAEIRRHAAGRDVGVGEEAEVLEIGHRVAERRRR